MAGGFQYLASFIASVSVNLFHALIVFLLFLYLRQRQSLAFVYQPRHRLVANALPPFPGGWFKWIRPMLTRDGEKPLVERLGTDAVMYLKFVHHSFKYFSIATVIAIGAAVLNGFGDNRIQDLSAISSSNLANGENAIWAHVVFGWLFSIIAYYYFLRIQIQYERLRRLFFAFKAPPYALIVRNVRAEDAADPERNLAPHFPHAAIVSVVSNTKKLDQLVRKRDRAMAKYNKAIERAGDSDSDGLESVDEKIEEEAQDHKPTRFAFIEYTSELQAQAGMHQSTYSSRPILAPAPEDIYWPSLYYSKAKRVILTIVVHMIVYFIVIAYLIPVAFVQGVASMENLQVMIPGLKPVADAHPVARGIVEGFIPALILRIFISLLPNFILPGLARLMGEEAKSWQEQRVLSWYFHFQFFSVYIGTIISGGFWGQLPQIIASSPQQIIPILGVTMPQTANFFLNYVFLQAVSGYSVKLMRPYIILRTFINKRRAKTDQEMEVACATGTSFRYGVEYALNLLVWQVGLGFAVIQPLIVPICALYFLCAYFVQRNNLISIHIRQYEAGGETWLVVFNRLSFSLFLAQCTWIALLSLKGGYVTIPLAPLPVMTFMFWLYVWWVRRTKHDFAVTKQAATTSFAAYMNKKGFQSHGGENSKPWETSRGNDASKAWDDVANGTVSPTEWDATDSDTATPSVESKSKISKSDDLEKTRKDEGTVVKTKRHPLVEEEPGVRRIDEGHYLVRQGEVDRLNRRCYLGYLAKPGTRITRVYEQPSLAVARHRVKITSDGARLSGESASSSEKSEAMLSATFTGSTSA